MIRNTESRIRHGYLPETGHQSQEEENMEGRGAMRERFEMRIYNLTERDNFLSESD